jgi:hypothetical protein
MGWESAQVAQAGFQLRRTPLPDRVTLLWHCVTRGA